LGTGTGDVNGAHPCTRDGFQAKLFVMKGTGRLYSEDMEDVMRRALAFVAATE
jgi:hypothetical protein